MTRRQQAIRLAQVAAWRLYKYDPELVRGGCSDVSEIIAEYLRRRGYRARAVYGTIAGTSRHRIMHAWLDVEGRQVDPTLWVQRLQRWLPPRKPLVRHEVRATLCGIDDSAIDDHVRRLMGASR